MDEDITSANNVRDFLDANKDEKEIVIEISSNGGFLSEGFEMYDLLKASGKKIYTIGYKVNSAAVLPFLAGTKRLVTPNAEFLIHNARIDTFDLGAGMLTAEDFERMANELYQADEQILNAYCKVIGEEKRSQVLAFMAAETDLGSKLAVKFGFAHGIHQATEKETKNQFQNITITKFWEDKPETYTKILQNKLKMENDEIKNLKEAQKKQEGIIMRLLNSFKAKLKNEVTLELSDGTLLSVAGDGELVGQAAMIVVDGIPSEPAPDGEHLLKDGRTIVIADGIITEVKESEDVQALKDEIANLQSQLEAKNTEISNLNNQFNELKNQSTEKLNQLEAEFTKFKNQIPGDPEKDRKKDDEGGPVKFKNEAERIWFQQKQRMQNLK